MGKLLYGLSPKLTLGAEIPVVLDQKVDSGLYEKSIKIKSGVSNIGDAQLFLKYHIFDRYFWSLATQVGATLPTGQSHNKVSVKKAGTGDGQTDLNLALKGDVLINEETFVKLGMRFSHQFKREYRDVNGDLIKEKLGDRLTTDLGFVKNFKNFGMDGTVNYSWWQGTERNYGDSVMESNHADLFTILLHFSIGDVKPQKHGKIDFYLDFPLTGKNSAATYRLGVSIKSIFKRK